MSFSFSALFASAENALKALAPAIPAVEAIAGVTETLVPSTAPVINAVEAGAASISALAPTAVQDATAMINAGRQAYTDLGSPLMALEQSLASLFHFSTVGQSVVLTPKTTAATAATAPVSPPGNALS